MTINQLKKLIAERFQYEPTAGQYSLISIIAEFLLDQEDRNLLVIKGYAGTGKTSIVKAIVKVLEEYNHGTVLLAPTGRSAKVLSKYSESPAFTIHKKIYKLNSDTDGNVKIDLFPNLHKNTLFVVDEASMISVASNIEENKFSGRSLLNDLIEYIYNGNNCRLILIGDTAQLPPVGMNISPALDIDFLQASYGFKLRSFELTEVVRQEADSGILFNATLIRKLLLSEKKSY
ncbi:MAG: AAA family ATPase, partial [Bacteroidetes bacterium]|nr:AAA family ATPase [Bacteroidota bacterium]